MRVLSERELKSVLDDVEIVLAHKEKFPLPVFSRPPRSVSFCSFDDVFSGDFFDVMKYSCKANGEDDFCFVMTKPSPIEYYKKNYGRIPAAQFFSSDNRSDFIDFVWRDRDSTPSGAIIVEAEEVVVFSRAASCVAYGVRELETAVIAGFNASADADCHLRTDVSFMNCEQVYDDHLNHFRKYTRFGALNIGRDEFVKAWSMHLSP